MSQEDRAVQTEEEAMSEIRAGYNNTAARDESPAEVVDEVIELDEPAEDEQLEYEQPEVTVKTLADELRDLKARVSASQHDPDTIRKMHGEIGNINRTLQEIKSPPPEPVVETDEDSAALDEITKEYPELAGPLVKNIKALQDKMAKLSTTPRSDPSDEIAAQVQAIRQKDAIEALEEEHPDYAAINSSPEFKKWLSTKPPEYKARIENTWNPAIVSRGLTEFKNSIKKSNEKHTRLAAAITPRGVPQKAGTSVLPDEDGLWIGYKSAR